MHSPVDLNGKPLTAAKRPLRIQVSPDSALLYPNGLLHRQWQSVAPAEIDEVDLRQSVRAHRDISDAGAQQTMMPGARSGTNRRLDVERRGQSLLHGRCENSDRRARRGERGRGDDG